MRYLLWAVGIVTVMTFLSVVAEANDDFLNGQASRAARLAPRIVNRVPASNLDPIPTVPDDLLPAELDGTTVEVGFSQDNEPEPHLLAVGAASQVRLFQLEGNSEKVDKRILKAPTEAPLDASGKIMPSSTFAKRVRQALAANYFTAGQPRPKSKCKDHYVVRIKMGAKFRERRGCTNQSNDPFAGFAQLFFRDAFIVWGRGQ